ncbi:MAG: HNH endonuclease signature motif containing protein [Candidatus Micrarchaeia archaeon]|jgi:5-methylcytosine-specific restriction endonuclease McrA
MVFQVYNPVRSFSPQGFSPKKKRRPIDKNVRSVVWRKYNGNSLDGKCYVCKRTITNDHFEIGHNKARAKGGTDNVSNLRPICGPCNRAMGKMSIEKYKAKYFGKKAKSNKRKKKSPKKSVNSLFSASAFSMPRFRF